MPCTSEIIADGSKLLIHATGAVTGSELNAMTQALMADIEAIQNIRWCLIDFEEVSELHATAAEIRTIAHLDEHLAKRIPKVTLAIAAPSNHVFGIARMWEAVAESTGWQIKICRSRAEADAWLRSAEVAGVV